MKIFLLLILAAFSAASSFPQEVDIVPYLKQIEAGEKKSVESSFPSLKRKNPSDPSVLFLEGVLQENGQDALNIYLRILKDHPDSKYADAALYRVYSYYYALGLYESATMHFQNLKKNYPNSPYIKIAEREIPEKSESVQVPKMPVSDTDKKTDQKIYKFTIQAGAFSNESNSEKLKKDFEKSGFETITNEKTVGGTVFHVVLVGKFETEEEARSFLQVINSEFNLDGRVVELSQQGF